MLKRFVPKKVETRIFILILVISLSISLLAARLIVLTQENAVMMESRNRLTRLAEEHVRQINVEFARLTQKGFTANDQIKSAVLGPSFAVSNATQPRDNVSATFSPDYESLPPRAQSYITASGEAMNFLSPQLLVEFSSFYITMNEDFIRISPSNAAEKIESIEAFGLRELYERVGPENNPTGAPIWMPAARDPKTNQWSTRLVVPLYRGTEFVGITGCEYSLDKMFDPIRERAGVEEFGSVYIFDDVGNIIAHPFAPGDESEHRYESDNMESGSKLVERYRAMNGKASQAAHLALEQGGVLNMAFVAPIGNLNWKLAVVADGNKMHSDLAALRGKLMASAVGCALFLVFLLRASFRQLFVSRIIGLERATRKFTEHGVIKLPDAGQDEIGSLVSAFEELVDSIAYREAELTVRNQQLKNEVSGRLKALESLGESERKFRTLFEKSSDAVLVYDGEHYVDCNEAAVDMLGCASKAELISTPPEEFSPKYQPDGRRSASKTRDMIERATAGGKHRYEWVCRRRDGREFWAEVLLTVIPYEGREALYTVWRDISKRKSEEEERVRLSAAIEQAAEAVIVTDHSGKILYINPSFEHQTGYTREETLDTVSTLFESEDGGEGLVPGLWEILLRGDVWKGRLSNQRKDGETYQAETTISPVRDASGEIRNFVVVSYDVTKEATLEAQLLQAQKMEAIGELASGIAHEINTPTQYIGDNIRFFQESFSDILQLLMRYQQLLATTRSTECAEALVNEIDSLSKSIELDYLIEELPIAIQQSLEGNSRVTEIVQAMKEFAHPGMQEHTALDINHAINSTISVARNEWKYVADVVTEFDPELPEVPCHPGSFNQVILSIIVNAAHAIGEVVEAGRYQKGQITVRTSMVAGWAEIRIQDNGPGIPQDIRRKIFDPFFTTKRVGKGTGQGLALVHAVIVEKHGGTIELDTEVGEGTIFIIRLPMAPQQQDSDTREMAGVTHGE